MSYDSEVLTDSPVCYFKLEEASGTSASDYQGNASSGTITAGSYQRAQTGPFSGATATRLYSGAYISIPYYSGLHPGEPITVEAWVKLNSTGGIGRRTVYSGNGNDLIVSFEADTFGADKLVTRKKAVQDVLRTSAQYTDQTMWHHYVWVKPSGSAGGIWRDGVECTPYDGSGTNAVIVGAGSGIQTIGSDVDGTDTSDWYLSRVAIYSGALSSARIQAHFNAAAQKLRPDADITTTGWSTAPLWSKIEEEVADGTVITATAS